MARSRSSERRVPKGPNAKALDAPGQLFRAAGAKNARAYTPPMTGKLPTGAAFPGEANPPIQDIWSSRVAKGYRPGGTLPPTR